MKQQDSTVRQRKNNPLASTQTFLSVSEIKDGFLILKNGGIRAVLQTSTINFSLKSEDEQNAIIYAYQGFLNLLDFPIQILIRSQKLDVDNYLEYLGVISEKHQNPLLKKQTVEYTQYVKRLVEYSDIMEKNFYVIVPMDPFRTQSRGMFQRFFEALHPKDDVSKIRQRYREFEGLKKGISPRVSTVSSGLSQCGLRTEQLNTHQLVNLLYMAYNPKVARNEKLESLGQMNVLQV